ncbi:MAG: protoporphyrin/coproporphyrin ferrochelatase [Myxococcales bacterium]|nr:protoporphyrin/coproporphyrin ferrochelatase [Myxococcales bacterium]
MRAGDAVLLIAHGTVEELDDLPEFLKNIRRGHAAPPELYAEVRRRYEAIGGRSPLNAINRELAKRLENSLGVPVRTANRLFHPYPQSVLTDLAAEGAKRIVVVPLAQHSAAVYGDAVKEAAEKAGLDLRIDAAANWGRMPELTEAFARSIVSALDLVPDGERDRTSLLITAHSLPVSIIEAGDPYEDEVRASAEEIVARVRELAPGRFVDHAVAFQSQGMSTGPGGRPMAWLGPDLRGRLEALAARGRKEVVIAPVGFLADHVEILYDLDIEARSWAEELGITLRRAPSLNASDGLVDVLATVARSVPRGDE